MGVGGVYGRTLAAVSAPPDPDATADHLSAGYLVALAGRLVPEVGALACRAGASGKRRRRWTIDTQIGFRRRPTGPLADDLRGGARPGRSLPPPTTGAPYRLSSSPTYLPEESS